ncbi:hypothetical protein SPBRAN_574 [uncultured Candidatus Thioglobus sp.]|nr:hypothetical protein SPBRAN_574 [uncultured Candidatus Thioglobus sp.]
MVECGGCGEWIVYNFQVIFLKKKNGIALLSLANELLLLC